MYTVVRDIHATLTLSTSCILHTGTAPAEAAEAAISFPAPAPSTAIFCDAVSPTPEPYHQKLGAHANQAIGLTREMRFRAQECLYCVRPPWEFHCLLPACQKALAASSFGGTGGQLRLV